MDNGVYKWTSVNIIRKIYNGYIIHLYYKVVTKSNTVITRRKVSKFLINIKKTLDKDGN